MFGPLGLRRLTAVLLLVLLGGCYRTTLSVISPQQSVPVAGVLSGTFMVAEYPLSKKNRIPKNPDRYGVQWDGESRHYRVTNFQGRSKQGASPVEYARAVPLGANAYLVQETDQRNWQTTFLHVIRLREDGFEYLESDDRQLALAARFGVRVEPDYDTGGIFIRGGTPDQVRAFLAEALRLGQFRVTAIYRRIP